LPNDAFNIPEDLNPHEELLPCLLSILQNNLVRYNQGGLSIHADSGGSATSLKGWIHNNLFTSNRNNPALYVEGRQSSPYQEVTIYRNYFTKNVSPYKNIIVLKQVMLTDFTIIFDSDSNSAVNV
jgi:hypothetical protein